ncbi:MAG: TRAP transporter large permease [Chloroflexota bacterium]
MSPEIVGLGTISALLLLLFLNIPVALCLILTGLVGYILINGVSQASFYMTGLWFASSISDYTIAVLPVFLLMGEFADTSGMMRDAFRATNIWLGNLRGGLAMASILGAAAFSAVSGSSMACAALMARVALPQLLEYKYDPALATGALCAGGTLGNLVPPGILLVFYAILVEISLGQLFIACLLPGVLLTLMYMVQIYIQCRIDPTKGPPAASTTWKEKLVASKYMLGVAIVFVMVMGGIQFGVFTPNEAASIGTVITFIYAVIKKTVNGQALIQSFKNTIITTGMICAVIIGANVFANAMAISQLPQMLAVWITDLHLSALGLVILMMIIYSFLGTALSSLTMILLTMPIFLPVLDAYDINLVWFGVLAIVQMELANLSPPVGINLFVVANIAKPKGISMGTVFRGSLPFCVTMLVFNIVLIIFPQISLFLVTRMGT